MLPVIALLGRPNVGKSTLFNQLTRTRDALVADTPGLTRDRQYGIGRIGGRPFIVVDTGGLGAGEGAVEEAMTRQSLRALEEADAAVFVVDGGDGLTPLDQSLADDLRRQHKPVILAVNKSEGRAADEITAEFHALGLGQPLAISATHRRGLQNLVNAALEPFPPASDEADDAVDAQGLRVAVIGRPNVGKSTLVNRFVGEDRVVASAEPGTTRDAIRVPFSRDGRDYVLVDTAGVRRRSRVREHIEKISVVKTLQAIDDAQVVIGLVDASEGITDQDASLLGLALTAGRATVLAVNKWDGLPPERRDRTRAELDLKLPFLSFAPVHFISALHGTGVGDLMASVNAAWAAASRDLPTAELTRVLEAAVERHAPPLVRGRRIKLRYAHQGGRNPPTIIVHGNQASRVPAAYRRYLENVFREAFDLTGAPVTVEFRSGDNPYADPARGRRAPDRRKGGKKRGRRGRSGKS